MSTLTLSRLEDRLTPAVAIQFDYSLDTNGFFGPAERAALERAAAQYTDRITDSLAAIEPGGFNTWSAKFPHPSTGQIVEVPNLTVPRDTMIVYVGASNLGAPNGIASTGYSASGTLSWLENVEGRGQANGTGSGATDFAAWGGAISFNRQRSWYAGEDAAGLNGSLNDLYTTAVHELGHLFGIGESASWFNNTSGGRFVGPNTQAAFGGPVPLEGDGGHWANGTTSGGQPAIYNPRWLTGTRGELTPLDLAALDDIGWDFDGGATSPPPPPPPPPRPGPGTPASDPPNELPSLPPVGEPVDGLDLYAVGSGKGAAPQALLAGPDGSARFTATPYELGFSGGVRAVSADVTGDGTPDLIVAPGPGRAPEVKIYDGVFGNQVGSFLAFEAAFAGGVHIAAGDFSGDGVADLVVSPDQGGGPRVRIVRGGGFDVMADFFGIDDPNFRGGARAAAGDVDGDGRDDLLVGAGYGGGPRVAVYEGASVAASRPSRLLGDFFAFEQSLRNGVFLAADDVNGDGRAEVVAGGGPGGAPRVLVLDGSQLLSSDGRTKDAIANFFAGSTNDRGGARVAAKDLDGDRFADLVVGNGARPQVSVYLGEDAAVDPTPGALTQYEPFRGGVGGVFVG